MTSQSLPQKLNNLTHKEYCKQYYKNNKSIISERKKIQYKENKESIRNKAKIYNRTIDGLVSKIFCNQRRSSIKRGYELPTYSLDDLKNWMYAQKNFETLYNKWVISGYDKNHTPSCDRLDDYKSYSLDNIRLTTWSINRSKGHSDRRNGINNKISKAVFQLTRDGIVFEEYASTMQASRKTGINRADISACCNGRQKSAGNYIWCFAMDGI